MNKHTRDIEKAVDEAADYNVIASVTSFEEIQRIYEG